LHLQQTGKTEEQGLEEREIVKPWYEEWEEVAMVGGGGKEKELRKKTQ